MFLVILLFRNDKHMMCSQVGTNLNSLIIVVLITFIAYRIKLNDSMDCILF